MGFDMQRLCGLGSNGASIMLEACDGVSLLLNNQVLFLVANHCIVHRLKLAAGQAANGVPYDRLFQF